MIINETRSLGDPSKKLKVWKIPHLEGGGADPSVEFSTFLKRILRVPLSVLHRLLLYYLREMEAHAWAWLSQPALSMHVLYK